MMGALDSRPMHTRLLDRLLRRKHPLFLTHNSPGSAFRAGEIYTDPDGAKWQISHWERVSDTALIDGGRAPCWQVYGRPTAEREPR